MQLHELRLLVNTKKMYLIYLQLLLGKFAHIAESPRLGPGHVALLRPQLLQALYSVVVGLLGFQCPLLVHRQSQRHCLDI